jgi:UDP-N-acetylmuramate--alanine ligase
MKTKQKYFFIGIKGAGMSALALLLKSKGHLVKGSDTEDFIFTESNLKKEQIEIYNFGHLKNNVDEDTTIIVGNSFNEDNNIDYKTAIALKLEIIPYTKFLSSLSNKHYSIAITGTHGKTSTVKTLSQLDWGRTSTKSISYLIGDGTGGCMEKKKGMASEYNEEVFLFEACEYQRNFLNYKPDITVITNIDFDHPDAFKDLQDTKHAFKEMINNTSRGVVVNGDDMNIKDILKDIDTQVVSVFTFGYSSQNDVVISHIEENLDTNVTSFKLTNEGKSCTVKIPFFGQHNIMNTAAAVSVQIFMNATVLGDLSMDLSNIVGANRRFQETKINNAILIDDYAHHPTEIQATIDACRRKYRNRTIVTIFQPHSFARMKVFRNEFLFELAKSDYYFVTDIYSPANRELLSEETIIDNNEHLYSIYKIRKISSLKDSVILFLSAGNIDKYKKEITGILEGCK